MREMLDKLYDIRGHAIIQRVTKQVDLNSRSREELDKAAYSVREWQNLLIQHQNDTVEMMNELIDAYLEDKTGWVEELKKHLTYMTVTP